MDASNISAVEIAALGGCEGTGGAKGRWMEDEEGNIVVDEKDVPLLLLLFRAGAGAAWILVEAEEVSLEVLIAPVVFFVDFCCFCSLFF